MRRDFDLALPRNMEMLLGFEVRSNGLEAWVRAWRVKFGVFCFFERLFSICQGLRFDDLAALGFKDLGSAWLIGRTGHPEASVSEWVRVAPERMQFTAKPSDQGVSTPCSSS